VQQGLGQFQFNVFEHLRQRRSERDLGSGQVKGGHYGSRGLPPHARCVRLSLDKQAYISKTSKIRQNCKQGFAAPAPELVSRIKPEHDLESGRGLERSTSPTEEETWLTPELLTISRLSAPAWRSCAESASGRMMRKRMCDRCGYHFVAPMAIR
jgi:hypothetical protein